MLLTSLAPKLAYGRAFGLERAGDNAGAILGPLLASVLVAVVGIRHTILAIVPGVFAAVYVLGYVVFAWEQHRWPILLIRFLLCGLGIGFAETAESTVVTQLLPEHLRSNGFEVLGLVQAFGDLGATPGRRDPLVGVLADRRILVRRDLDDPVGRRLGMAAPPHPMPTTGHLMNGNQRT
jgi:MFS family permease